MKRITVLAFMICAILLCLNACILLEIDRTPWEEGKQKDVFFEDDVLAEYGFEDMPVPKLDNSYRGVRAVYLNLSRAEYEEYVRELVEYLLQKDEQYHKGFKCGEHSVGWLLVPLYGDDFAPLTENYTDYSNDEHTFCLSLSPEYEISDEKYYFEKLVKLNIRYDEVSPYNSKSDFSYTVELVLSSVITDSYQTDYYPCYFGHTYQSASYPVPGSEMTVTINSCNRCDKKEQSDYIGSGDYKLHTVSVAEGEDFVIEAKEGCYSGALYELKTVAVIDAELKVTVNGTEIPRTHYDSDYWGYSFIMPAEDIEIAIEIVGDSEDFPYFSKLNDHESWINTLEPSAVAKVRITSKNSGSVSGSLKEIQSSVDPTVISSFISTLKNREMKRVSSDPTEDPLVTAVEIILKDGSVYSVTFSDLRYYVGGFCYELEVLPSLLGYNDVTKAYSFVVSSDTYAVYGGDNCEIKLGEISLDDIEFAEYDGEDTVDLAPIFVIKTEFDDICVYTDTVFCVNVNGKTNYYELIEGSFGDLISGAEK